MTFHNREINDATLLFLYFMLQVGQIWSSNELIFDKQMFFLHLKLCVILFAKGSI